MNINPAELIDCSDAEPAKPLLPALLIRERDEDSDIPGFASVAIEKSFAFQSCDVLHDRRLAGETEVVLNFARARRDSFLALLGLNEIEYAFLPIGQHTE